MARIYLETFIDAPIERVFDLSRSIDMHQYSVANTKEKAVAGRTSGLISIDETVTWRAKHLGIYQHLTVKITVLERPEMFQDVMLKGAFSFMEHTHKFESHNNGTMMIDIFDFGAPLGWLGKFAEWLFLKKYMTRFLLQRNEEIKNIAESDQWKKFLKN